MTKVVSLEACFARFSDTFAPKIVAELNGQHVKPVRCEPDGIAHTGAVRSEITKDRCDRLETD